MCHQTLVRLSVATFHEHPFSGSSVVICGGINVAILEVQFLNFLYEYSIKIPEPVYANEIIFQTKFFFRSSSHLTC